MPLGPFDPTSGAFLSLYLTLLAATIATSLVIPRRMRPNGRPQRVEDVEALAYLAGGSKRLQEALVARLVVAGSLAVTAKRRFRVMSRPTGVTGAEASILALRVPVRWREIGGALRMHAEMIRRRLSSAGLIIDDVERARMRFWSTLPYVALLAFGSAEWVIGEADPANYLAALVAATVLLAICRWTSIDCRTHAGRAALAKAKVEADRLRIAPTRAEAGLAVALFGTSTLKGSGWANYRRPPKLNTDYTDAFDDIVDWICDVGEWASDGGSDGAGCGSCGGGGCGS